MKKTSIIIKDESSSLEGDPFLLHAGTPIGNMHRKQRAIITLQQQDMANQDRIRTLRLENEKLRSKLQRLQQQALETERIEARFDQLSTIILESRYMNSPAQSSSDSES